jgi:hypothetical protein
MTKICRADRKNPSVRHYGTKSYMQRPKTEPFYLTQEGVPEQSPKQVETLQNVTTARLLGRDRERRGDSRTGCFSCGWRIPGPAPG